jgi:hypothetical protein
MNVARRLFSAAALAITARVAAGQATDQNRIQLRLHKKG